MHSWRWAAMIPGGDGDIAPGGDMAPCGGDIGAPRLGKPKEMPEKLPRRLQGAGDGQRESVARTELQEKSRAALSKAPSQMGLAGFDHVKADSKALDPSDAALDQLDA
eukprot:CAMPEP_0197706792 /NCGR_PEP_ID=MMETSP1338-20131121/127124_1 /TAXON_ID=43686 ORGANISM="Pelagodinium beii, Strain RCC1491" /NCGR_SAMPLE_ID=MMETSP1338 /ASSEMBLY_ACC=CAM_ASM_000754 /LENGTH=107 /DNA_ID=CAMNT_0043290709 /DNA_START=293 /DNA_END=618 /DNA_ORIENTATION=+